MDAAEVKTQLKELVGLVTSIDKNLTVQVAAFAAQNKRVDTIEEKIGPIAEHVTMVKGFFKALAVTCMVTGAAGAVVGIVVAFAKH